MSAAPGKRPSLVKKPSSANPTPKTEAPKLPKMRRDGYVKPAAAAADAAKAPKPKIRSDGYVKPAAAAVEANAAKAAKTAAKGEKQLEDVSDSPHREQAWTRLKAARSTPAAQPPTSLYAPQLEALFENLDSNQTGSLSLDEFQQFLESIQCKHTHKQVRAAMKKSKKRGKQNAPATGVAPTPSKEAASVAKGGLGRAAEVALTAPMKPTRKLKDVVVDPAAMERALLKLLSEAKFEELLQSEMCKAGGVEQAGFGAAIRMARNGQKPKKVPPLPQGKQHLTVGKRDNMLLLLLDIMDPEGNDAVGIWAFSLLYLPPLDGGARIAAHFAEISASDGDRETFTKVEFMRFALRELEVFSDAEFYHLVTQIRQRPGGARSLGDVQCEVCG